MTPIVLDGLTFWEVVWEMIILFFLIMAIWIFIAIMVDVFRRNDISGWVKALWVLGLVLFPLLGALVYIIFRPVTEQDRQMMTSYQAQMQRASGYSPAEEIAKAQQLRDSGAITADEFEALKRRAMG